LKLFDWENKLTTDTCAQQLRAKDNDSYLQYNLANFYDVDCESQTRTELLAKYPNLRYREGYGVARPCAIDSDSDVRLIAPTHGPERRQLFSRNFQAVPSFNRGCLNLTTVESTLINGESSALKDCDKYAEHDFQRFTPLTSCMQSWIQGRDFIPFGANTRELWRQTAACAKKNMSVE